MLSAAEITALASAGLSAEQLAAVAKIVAEREAAAAEMERARREASRLRKQRSRASHVTVTACHVTSRDGHGMSRDTPPPSPPPPFSPTPPLTPAPTPAPVSTPARTREAAKDERAIADEASAAQLPLTLHAHAGFRAAWAEWCGYRTERATVPLKSARVPWTLRAATNLLSECERLAPMLGLDAIAARIREAIASNWKGPCLTDIRTPRPPTAGTPAKSHQPERLHTSI